MFGIKDHNQEDTQSPSFAASVAHRRLPVNLREEDKPLFAVELIKEIPASAVRFETNVDIFQNSLFACRRLAYLWNYSYINHRNLNQRALLSNIARHLLAYRNGIIKADGAIWITNEWSQGYFHWLTESLTRLELAIDQAHIHPVVIPSAYRQTRFIEESLQYLGVNYVFAPESEVLRVKKLVLPSHTAMTGNFNERLLVSLADRFARRYESLNGSDPGGNTKRAGRRVWISRAAAPKRRIINENELVPILDRFGFEICYLEHLDFAKQVDLCRAAEIIGGLHGAGLTNMLFMPGGGTVLEIRKTADTHSNCYFSMASALNHRYYYALADAVGDDVHVSDFYVRPARLQEVLSEMIVPDPGK